MTKAAVSRLRVSDVLAQLDYNGFPFWKSRSRSNFPLGEYGIRRILFHFQANRRSSPQSTRIRSPDKTRHIRLVAVLPLHHGSLPPNPDIFCNTALDHLISAYAVSRVLQPERFGTSRGKSGGRRKILFKSFENILDFSNWWTLYSEKS